MNDPGAYGRTNNTVAPVRGVKVLDATVVKSYSREQDGFAERSKTVAGEKLGNLSGLFVAPELVEFGELEAIFSRIHGIEPLRSRLGGPDRYRLASRAGRALAAIHLRLDVRPSLRLESEHSFGFEVSPAHGDFSIANVQYRASTDDLVILDWCSAEWLGTTYTHADPCLDLSIFLVSLFYQRPRDPLLVKRPESIALAFLSGYSEDAKLYPTHLSGVCRFATNTFLLNVPGGWRRKLRVPYLYRLERFLRRLEVDGL